ncbi:MAG: hypothetical protein ACRDJU_05905 [Actinomycetota bacterium]
MSDQPPSHQPPRSGPWPRAVPPYAPPPYAPPGPPPAPYPLPGPPTGLVPPPPGESRLLLSRWTKRIAWLGVAATGVFSFVAARSLPGRSATPPASNQGGSQVSGSTGDPANSTGDQPANSTGDQPDGTGSAQLQPAAQPPQASARRSYLRSGGS